MKSKENIFSEKNILPFFLITILSIVIVYLSLGNGLFWDNVLFSGKLTKVLYDNGPLNWASIPSNLDSGHPTLLATYLSSAWRVFGKSLSVSHWALLPFVIGCLWQIYRLISFFTDNNWVILAGFILVSADPTFLAQLTLVSPEVMQIFFFLLALNSVLRKDLLLKTIALAFLGLVSYRGMMLCAGIFIIDSIVHVLINKEKLQTFIKQNWLSYLIGAFPALSYIVWRHLEKGWVFTNPSPNWENLSQFDSTSDYFKNTIKNITVFGFHVQDFGRIVLVIFILGTFYFKRKKIDWKQYKIPIVITIFATIVIYLICFFIRIKLGNRYFIASYIGMALLALLLLLEHKNKVVLYLVLLLSLIGGNFIVYPDSFAQSWDASLAHTPYWELRKNAIEYLDEKHIPIENTATFFPNKTNIDNIDLNGDMRSFTGFTGQEPYVVYSNVFNLNDENLSKLKEDYKVIKSFNKRNVRVEILQKK